MKIFVSILLIGFSMACDASVVRMQLNGIVNEVTVGDRFSIGSNFRVELDYTVPQFAFSHDATEALFDTVPAIGSLIIGGETFYVREMGLSLQRETAPSGDEWVIIWALTSPFGDIFQPPYMVSDFILDFRIPVSSIDDHSRLPSSLSEWNLNDGSVELVFLNEDASQGLPPVASGFSSVDIGVISLDQIPEPSGMMLLCCGGILSAMRRKRIDS